MRFRAISSLPCQALGVDLVQDADDWSMFAPRAATLIEGSADEDAAATPPCWSGRHRDAAPV
ncbi:MAG: hypothetical protein ACR2FQ_11180 [Pseudonocardiaceae bacterium]